jgi:hypothetical protein
MKSVTMSGHLTKEAEEPRVVSTLESKLKFIADFESGSGS